MHPIPFLLFGGTIADLTSERFRIQALQAKHDRENGLIDIGSLARHDLHRLIECPPLSPAFAATGEVNPMLYVLAVNFDGSLNDFTDVSRGSNETLIAHCHKELHDANGFQKASQVQSIYVRGVGTNGPIIESETGSASIFPKTMDGITGASCSDRAEAAYGEIKRRVLKISKEIEGAKFHIHVTGFSRGGATALHFMNLVHTYGFIDFDSIFPHEKGFFKPGSIPMSAVLIDCVCTGQKDSLKLNLPISLVSVMHLIADGEERRLFPTIEISENRLYTAHGVSSASISNEPINQKLSFTAPDSVTFKRFIEVHLPGARHSDAGGVYKKGGYQEVSKYLVATFRASLGLNVDVCKPSSMHIQTLKANDSRWVTGKVFDVVMDSLCGTGRLGNGRRRIVPKTLVSESNHRDGVLNVDDLLRVDQSVSPASIPIRSDDVLKSKFPKGIEAYRIINETEHHFGEMKNVGCIALESIECLSKSDALAFFDSLNGRAEMEGGYQIERNYFLGRLTRYELENAAIKGPMPVEFKDASYWKQIHSALKAGATESIEPNPSLLLKPFSPVQRRPRP